MGDKDSESKKEAKRDSRGDKADSSLKDWFNMKFRKSNKKKKSTLDSSGSKDQSNSFDYDDPKLPPLKPLQPLPFDSLKSIYEMTGNKHMLIFNHMEYEKTAYYCKYKNGRPSSREYTDRDVRRLREVFSNELGFNIDIHTDSKYYDIYESVKGLSLQDHRDTSCVCVVIMTHGDTDDELMAKDMPYDLEILVTLLQKGNKWLRGKPKLFIVQACRGGEVDKALLMLDGSDDKVSTSTHADTLVFRSSVEGYVSWKDEDGSWLIQELCRVVHATHSYLDFLRMTSMVTALVVNDHKSSTKNPADNNTKQTPEVRSTLTKMLYFTASDPNADSETQ